MTTTYSKEINIYNTDAIQESINEAGTTASNYITEVSADNGIVVATEGHGTTDGAITASTTGWHIGDVLEFLRQGISRFWIGLKDPNNDTTPTVRIGKAYNSQASDNESHMELDYHSMKLIDKENDTYFHVSDLKDTSDTCLVTEVLNIYGNWVTVNASTIEITPSLSVMHAEVYPGLDAVLSVVSVEAEGVTFTDIDTDGYYINAFWSGGFTEPYTVTITYETSSKFAKAYTAGLRYSGSGYLGNPGAMSFAEGCGGIAAGFATHVEGVALNTSLHGNLIAGGLASHAEGLNAKAYGDGAHSEGFRTTALGDYSHSEGRDSYAGGQASHSEGRDTKASLQYAHAEGFGSVAGGAESHAQNQGTKAAKSAQTALGTYNIEDTSSATTHPSGSVGYGQYAVIVGNGTANNARSDALRVEWSGNVRIAGDVKNMSGTNLYTKTRVKGNAESSYRTGDVNLTPANIGALALSGGTITAGLTSKSSSNHSFSVQHDYLDAKQANNGITETRWPQGTQVVDKNGLVIAGYLSSVYTSGAVAASIYAYNYNTSGTQVGSGHINLMVDKSGNVTYDVTTPQAFRNAIGIGAYGSLTEQSSTLTLTTSWQKIPLSSSKFVGQGCSVSSNGLKVASAGTYMIWGSMYLGTGYTVNDTVHLGIYKTTGSASSQMYDWRKRVYNANPYEVFNAGPIVLTLAANDVIDLRAYNQGGSRGTVNSLTGAGLVIKRIA